MREQIWMKDPDSRKLVSPYEFNRGELRLEAAQTFTVSLSTVVVAQDLDGMFRGRNDIMVITRSSMGEQPLVERIHCFEEEVPKGRPIRNILAETMFICDDYNGIDKLWLEIDVIEVDSDTGERKQAVQSFQNLAATTGSIFPCVMPYAFGASALGGLLGKLADIFERDEHVVRVPFALFPGEPRFGRAPLQAGTYVAFAKPQDPANFAFQANGTLTSGNKPSEVSYAIFDIAPVRQVSPKFVINQKVATLLTQIDSGNERSALSTLSFLQDTLTNYDYYKKLRRYRSLSNKRSLSDAEQALKEEIEGIDALQDFLPDGD